MSDLPDATATLARVDALLRLGSALVRPIDPEGVLRVLDDVGFEAAGADSLALAVRDDDRDELRVAMMVHREAGDISADARWLHLPIDVDSPQSAVVRGGHSLFIESFEDFAEAFPHLADEARDRGHVAWACLPMIAGDRLVGVLGLSWLEPQTFDDGERTVLEAMANWVAQAYAQAQLVERHRATARRLQLALLPTLKRLPDFEQYARYEPAGHDALVGGDWFDIAAIDDDRVLVTVGDVTGHGVGAAAAMSELRPSLRGLVAGGASPAEALAYLDRELEGRATAVLATAAVIVIDRHTGELTCALAGHPPPLILRLGGDRPEWLGTAPGPILGAGLGGTYRQHTDVLDVGDVLVGFTDGAFERRDSSLDAALEELAAQAWIERGDLAALCSAIVENQLATPEGSRDDIVVLALRRR